MKNFMYRLLIVFGMIFVYPSFAQTLSEKITKAEKIYVAPIQFYKYYAIKVGPNLWTKPYSFNGEFAPGDIVSVTDPNISWEIVGEVPSQLLDDVYANFLKQLQDKWGADKVEAWPEDLMNKMGAFNEKDIDCSFYVMMERVAWQEPLRLTKLSSANPDVPSVIKGGTENITITIFEKVKAGKKGKKAVKVMKNPFYDLAVEFAETKDNSAAGAAFCQKANDQLQSVIDEMLVEFFTEIDNN